SSVLPDRQSDDECCAGSWSAFDGHSAPMRLHDMFYDRQPETRPSGVPGTVFVNTVKPFKDVRLITQRNSWTVVLKSNNRALLVPAQLNLYCDARFASMFESVIKQIKNDLFEAN